MFLLVFLSTLPVAIPFLVFHRVALAMRVSNLIAIVMLFAMGYAFARLTGRGVWFWSASMVVLGLMLAGLTIALGG